MRAAERIDRTAGGYRQLEDSYWVRRREALYRWFAGTCRQAGHTRVLDAGCRTGDGSAILAAAGLEVVGIDTDSGAVASAARTYRFGRISFRRSDSCATREPQHSFDAIISAGIVEHLVDPQSMCAEARRILRPKGTIVVATANRLTASPGRTRPIDGEHVWEYTPDELHNLMGWRFPGVRLLGMFHGLRLRALEKVIGESLPFTLRRLAAADRAAWLRVAMRRVRAEDFVVGPGVVRHALDLVAVANA